MSVHKPFTRGGRQLVLVRPRPFVPPPVPVQLWRMLRRPSAGVALVLRSQPRPARLAIAVGAAGLVGVLLSYLFGRAETGNRYFPFHVIAVLLAAWGLAALLLCAAGRLLGARPHQRLRPALQVTGVAICAAPLLAAIVPFPTAARLVFCAWLAAVCYQTSRQAYGLGNWRAAIAALPAPAALAALWLSLHA